MKHEEISMYTKKALSEALKEALKTKPFKKITVSELIEACNINRKTFYYHFADIPDASAQCPRNHQWSDVPAQSLYVLPG